MPILARPIGPFPRAYRRVMRNKLTSALVTIAVLAVVGGAVYSAVRWFAERAARQETEVIAYNLTVRETDRDWEDGRADKALALLEQCPPHLRGWEGHFLKRRCGAEESILVRHAGASCLVATTPDGMRLRFLGTNGRVLEWDLATRREVGKPLAITGEKGGTEVFDDTARYAAARPAESNRVTVWDLESRRVSGSFPVPADG